MCNGGIRAQGHYQIAHFPALVQAHQMERHPPLASSRARHTVKPLSSSGREDVIVFGGRQEGLDSHMDVGASIFEQNKVVCVGVCGEGDEVPELRSGSKKSIIAVSASSRSLVLTVSRAFMKHSSEVVDIAPRPFEHLVKDPAIYAGNTNYPADYCEQPSITLVEGESMSPELEEEDEEPIRSTGYVFRSRNEIDTPWEAEVAVEGGSEMWRGSYVNQLNKRAQSCGPAPAGTSTEMIAWRTEMTRAMRVSGRSASESSVGMMVQGKKQSSGLAESPLVSAIHNAACPIGSVLAHLVAVAPPRYPPPPSCKACLCIVEPTANRDPEAALPVVPIVFLFRCTTDIPLHSPPYPWMRSRACNPAVRRRLPVPRWKARIAEVELVLLTRRARAGRGPREAANGGPRALLHMPLVRLVVAIVLRAPLCPTASGAAVRFATCIVRRGIRTVSASARVPSPRPVKHEEAALMHRAPRSAPRPLQQRTRRGREVVVAGSRVSRGARGGKRAVCGGVRRTCPLRHAAPLHRSRHRAGPNGRRASTAISIHRALLLYDAHKMCWREEPEARRALGMSWCCAGRQHRVGEVSGTEMVGAHRTLLCQCAVGRCAKHKDHFEDFKAMSQPLAGNNPAQPAVNRRSRDDST
ncbi:hypothetical protein FB451DRAFT_1162400 [Mycena latifolia]|nr:hypothetical protein FB451DRAFT_1162400 [Mycena latifolia]